MSLYSYIYQKPQKQTFTHDHAIRKILIRSATALFSLLIFLFSSLLLNNLEKDYVSPVTAQTNYQNQSTLNQSEHGSGQAINNQQLAISFSPSPSPTPLPTEALAKSGYHLCTTCDKDGISNLPSSTPTQKLLSPTPYPLIPTPYPLNPAKSLYTIAIIGDSMVDTMGEVLEYLDSALKKKYKQYPMIREKFKCEKKDKYEIIREIIKKINIDGKRNEDDGLRIDEQDGWFLIRASGTEPIIRLTMEYKNKKKLEERTNELRRMIRIFIS